MRSIDVYPRIIKNNIGGSYLGKYIKLGLMVDNDLVLTIMIKNVNITILKKKIKIFFTYMTRA